MARLKVNTHRVVTFLSDWQMKTLRRISKRPTSALVRDAVTEFCKRHDKRK
jgi:hypothetical protein